MKQGDFVIVFFDQEKVSFKGIIKQYIASKQSFVIRDTEDKLGVDRLVHKDFVYPQELVNQVLNEWRGRSEHSKVRWFRKKEGDIHLNRYFHVLTVLRRWSQGRIQALPGLKNEYLGALMVNEVIVLWVFAVLSQHAVPSNDGLIVDLKGNRFSFTLFQQDPATKEEDLAEQVQIQQKRPSSAAQGPLVLPFKPTKRLFYVYSLLMAKYFIPGFTHQLPEKGLWSRFFGSSPPQFPTGGTDDPWKRTTFKFRFDQLMLKIAADPKSKSTTKQLFIRMIKEDIRTCFGITSKSSNLDERIQLQKEIIKILRLQLQRVDTFYAIKEYLDSLNGNYDQWLNTGETWWESFPLFPETQDISRNAPEWNSLIMEIFFRIFERLYFVESNTSGSHPMIKAIFELQNITSLDIRRDLEILLLERSDISGYDLDLEITSRAATDRELSFLDPYLRVENPNSPDFQGYLFEDNSIPVWSTLQPLDAIKLDKIYPYLAVPRPKDDAVDEMYHFYIHALIQVGRTSINAQMIMMDIEGQPLNFSPQQILPFLPFEQNKLFRERDYVNPYLTWEQKLQNFVLQHELVAGLMAHEWTKEVVLKHLDEVCFVIEKPTQFILHLKQWFTEFYSQSFSTTTSKFDESKSGRMVLAWKDQSLLGIFDTHNQEDFTNLNDELAYPYTHLWSFTRYEDQSFDFQHLPAFMNDTSFLDVDLMGFIAMDENDNDPSMVILSPTFDFSKTFISPPVMQQFIPLDPQRMQENITSQKSSGRYLLTEMFEMNQQSRLTHVFLLNIQDMSVYFVRSPFFKFNNLDETLGFYMMSVHTQAIYPINAIFTLEEIAALPEGTWVGSSEFEDGFLECLNFSLLKGESVSQSSDLLYSFDHCMSRLTEQGAAWMNVLATKTESTLPQHQTPENQTIILLFNNNQIVFDVRNTQWIYNVYDGRVQRLYEIDSTASKTIFYDNSRSSPVNIKFVDELYSQLSQYLMYKLIEQDDDTYIPMIIESVLETWFAFNEPAVQLLREENLMVAKWLVLLKLTLFHHEDNILQQAFMPYIAWLAPFSTTLQTIFSKLYRHPSKNLIPDVIGPPYFTAIQIGLWSLHQTSFIQTSIQSFKLDETTLPQLFQQSLSSSSSSRSEEQYVQMPILSDRTWGTISEYAQHPTANLSDQDIPEGQPFVCFGSIKLNINELGSACRKAFLLANPNLTTMYEETKDSLFNRPELFCEPSNLTQFGNIDALLTQIISIFSSGSFNIEMEEGRVMNGVIDPIDWTDKEHHDSHPLKFNGYDILLLTWYLQSEVCHADFKGQHPSILQSSREGNKNIQLIGKYGVFTDFVKGSATFEGIPLMQYRDRRPNESNANFSWAPYGLRMYAHSRSVRRIPVPISSMQYHLSNTSGVMKIPRASTYNSTGFERPFERFPITYTELSDELKQAPHLPFTWQLQMATVDNSMASTDVLGTNMYFGQGSIFNPSCIAPNRGVSDYKTLYDQTIQSFPQLKQDLETFYGTRVRSENLHKSIRPDNLMMRHYHVLWSDLFKILQKFKLTPDVGYELALRFFIAHPVVFASAAIRPYSVTADLSYPFLHALEWSPVFTYRLAELLGTLAKVAPHAAFRLFILQAFQTLERIPSKAEFYAPIVGYIQNDESCYSGQLAPKLNIENMHLVSKRLMAKKLYPSPNTTTGNVFYPVSTGNTPIYDGHRQAFSTLVISIDPRLQLKLEQTVTTMQWYLITTDNIDSDTPLGCLAGQVQPIQFHATTTEFLTSTFTENAITLYPVDVFTWYQHVSTHVPSKTFSGFEINAQSFGNMLRYVRYTNDNTQANVTFSPLPFQNGPQSVAYNGLVYWQLRTIKPITAGSELLLSFPTSHPYNKAFLDGGFDRQHSTIVVQSIPQKNVIVHPLPYFDPRTIPSSPTSSSSSSTVPSTPPSLFDLSSFSGLPEFSSQEMNGLFMDQSQSSSSQNYPLWW
jgi:hypothetical protein